MAPGLGWVVGSLGHLIFETMMGFIAFGGVGALFASLVALAAWLISQLIR
jgi:hypothetical protein